MKFSDLNPQMVQITDHHVLKFDCPVCKMRIAIDVRIGVPSDNAHRLWMITLGKDWDAVTVTPSISNHSKGRKWPECTSHISIINGEVNP